MRIVHTADWHIGRVWKGHHRIAEMERVLDHLARFLIEEKIDLLLVAGDLFENGAPTADAERLVFDFFRRVGASQTQTMVIAGNHDSAERLDAWGRITELVRVHTLGKPRRAAEGGVRKFETVGGEVAVVAAIPFAHPRYFLSALDQHGDETAAKSKYAAMFQRVAEQLAREFTTGTVNLMMAHTHLDGAVLTAGSERQVHLGEQWAATRQALPSQAHYVALGHIHKPQEIEAPSPARYCGSPLQLDFGEAGEEKSFVVIEAEPGRPVRTTLVPYEGGTPLVDLRLELPEIQQQADELAQRGWLRVTVPLEEPNPDLNRIVRELLPNAIVVRPELPSVTPTTTTITTRRLETAPRELYAAYFQHQYQREPQEPLLEAFEELYEECQAEREHTA